MIAVGDHGRAMNRMGWAIALAGLPHADPFVNDQRLSFPHSTNRLFHMERDLHCADCVRLFRSDILDRLNGACEGVANLPKNQMDRRQRSALTRK